MKLDTNNYLSAQTGQISSKHLKKQKELIDIKDTFAPSDKDTSGEIISFKDLKGLVGEKEKILSNSHTQEKAKALLERKKDGLKEEVVINTDSHMHSIYHGVPSFVNSFNHKGVTFRHYLGSQEQKDSALKEESLIAGPVPYVQKGGMRYDYVDLIGVFLTKPDVNPETVGVPGHNLYIDMKLPDDTAVLEIEPGRIYMIAGDPKRPDWVIDYYNKYIAGEEIPSYMKSTMERIKQEGGLKEPTRVYFNEVTE